MKNLIFKIPVYSTLAIFLALSTIGTFAQTTDKNKQKTATDKKNKSKIDAPVDYAAVDSILFSADQKIMYMYGDANVKYNGIELKAANIEMNLDSSIVYATPILDEDGVMIGRPWFKDGKDEFSAEKIVYNFKTGKGLIYGVWTEQAGGYLLSDITKKQDNGHIHIKGGKFTSCDMEHPHFYLHLTRAEVIPNEKIIAGPLYFVMSGIPLPVGLPFGYFPNNSEKTSGILLPQYGEEGRRGFFLRNGGYYFLLGEYFDLALRGEIYSKGSWGINAASRYNVRYRFNGNLNFNYNLFVDGEKGLSNYNQQRSMSVNWTHTQDAKARPNSSFSANVNFTTNDFSKYNATSHSDYARSTRSSSINYSKRFPGKPFNFSANINATQNTQTKQMSITLPTMAFNVSRQMPFDKLIKPGKGKSLDFIKKIGISYSANFKNSGNFNDSLVFSNPLALNFSNAFKHSIPVSTSFTLLKYFQVSPSFNYTGRVYTEAEYKYWSNSLFYTPKADGTGTYTYGKVLTDTIAGLSYVHDWSFSTPLSTTLYGFYYPLFFKKSIQAIRHVVTPSISFNYTPDFGTKNWGYYERYYSSAADTVGVIYSPYNIGGYGVPPNGRNGSISFSIGNNLEMKVLNRKDTVESYKKIKILESFSIGTSYNLAADSMRLAPVSISGRTTLFENMGINFGGTLTPYDVSETGREINRMLINSQHKLLRLKNFYLSTGINLSSNKASAKSSGNKSGDKEQPEVKPSWGIYDDYEVFDGTWSFRADYSFNIDFLTFNKETRQFTPTVRQDLRFGGSLAPTKNWRINYQMAYDIKTNQFQSPSLSFYRDLHCWEASLSVIPFGTLKSYNFRINIKSSLFQGVEYKKERSRYD